jgi:hypothetical protein
VTQTIAPVTPVRDTHVGRNQVCRLVLAVLSVALLEIGYLGFAVGADWLRLVCFMVFCFLGIGSAPWQLNATIGTYERLALTFVTSVTVLTFVPLVMIALHVWYPAAAFVIVAAACLPPHVLYLLTLFREVDPARGGYPSAYLPLATSKQAARRTVADGLPATTAAVVGALICIASALAHRHLTPGFYGFLPHIGIAWFVGLALLLIAVALRGSREHSLAIPVFLIVLVLTLTPALTYDGPRSQAAAKHVDFVLQIQTLHDLSSTLPVYNAWAGFFAAMAWLCDITGVTDPMRLATAWPALLGLFRVVVLRYLAGQILPRADYCWIAVTLAVLADSISADYFSPQSVGFVLGMAAVGIALSRNRDLPRLWTLLITGMTLAVTHQLSPYIAGGVLVVLVVFRQLRPWWTPALILGPALAWALMHWTAVQGFVSFGEFGQVGNFRPPKTIGAAGLKRLPVVDETVLALVAGILIVGLLALVTLIRYRRDLRCWALACCPGIGIILVATNPYGQEGIFRAALFGVPWLAILAGPLFVSGRRFVRVALLATSAVLCATFLVSSFGLDAVNVIRPGDLAAVRHYQTLGGPRPPYPYYLLRLTPGDQPTAPSVEGGTFAMFGAQSDIAASSDVLVLTKRLLRRADEPVSQAELFALYSPAGAEYGQAYALQSPSQSAALRHAFLVSPFWTVDFQQDGSYLFKFQPARYLSLQK